jgi:hypothetical protein
MKLSHRVAIFEKKLEELEKLEKGSFFGKMLEKLEFNILFSSPWLEKLENVYFSLFTIYHIYPCSYNFSHLGRVNFKIFSNHVRFKYNFRELGQVNFKMFSNHGGFGSHLSKIVLKSTMDGENLYCDKWLVGKYKPHLHAFLLEPLCDCRNVEMS